MHKTRKRGLGGQLDTCYHTDTCQPSVSKDPDAVLQNVWLLAAVTRYETPEKYHLVYYAVCSLGSYILYCLIFVHPALITYSICSLESPKQSLYISHSPEICLLHSQTLTPLYSSITCLSPAYST